MKYADETPLFAQYERRPSRPDRYFRYVTIAFFFVNCLFAVSLFKYRLLFPERTSSSECVRPKLTYSPGSDHTTYEKRRLFRSLDDNPYVGPPTDEYDEAWGHIVDLIPANLVNLKALVIRLTPEEYAAASLEDESLALADGSGYLAEMAVYHELHCIKRVRRHFYFDRYYQNLSDSELERENFHIEHCLEYWREAAVCRADPTLTTMFWRDGMPTSRSYDDHECVNWEQFDTWARSRMFSTEDEVDKLEQAGRYELISNEKGATFDAGHDHGHGHRDTDAHARRWES